MRKPAHMACLRDDKRRARRQALVRRRAWPARRQVDESVACSLRTRAGVLTGALVQGPFERLVTHRERTAAPATTSSDHGSVPILPDRLSSKTLLTL